MDEDWAIDVRKYVPDADSGVIAGIVRYCGIALRNRDSSLVSFSDPTETDRVRENFLKKKLGLTDPDSSLDTAIAAVGARMAGDNTKNRVTVYYLLAEHFGKLGLFGAAAAPVAAPVAAPLPLMAAAAAAPVAAVAPVAATTARRKPAGGYARGLLAPLALLVIGGLGVFTIVSSKHKAAPVAVVAAAPAVAPVAAPAVVIPTGSGLVSSEIDGKPMVSVYFDTAKTDVSPDIVPAAATVKAYLDAHPGSKLAVSGYNDPRGDAAMNAELSKNRAFAVRDALVANGIAADAIELVKPEATTDTTTSLENARRVDIKIV